MTDSGWIKINIKNSKFHARVFHVSSTEDVSEVLKQVEDEFKKSTHIVYAYRIIDEDAIREYSTDAGEPTHSSGPPILKVLAGAELLDVLLVVVRYYGGIKLGIGGLIKAYTEAGHEAIKQARISRRTNKKIINIRTNYKELGEMLYKIGKVQGEVVEIVHGDGVTIKARIPLSFCKRFETDELE